VDGWIYFSFAKDLDGVAQKYTTFICHRLI